MAALVLAAAGLVAALLAGGAVLVAAVRIRTVAGDTRRVREELVGVRALLRRRTAKWN